MEDNLTMSREERSLPTQCELLSYNSFESLSLNIRAREKYAKRLLCLRILPSIVTNGCFLLKSIDKIHSLSKKR